MENRVKFDFEIYFTNGGSIKGEDFRLDIQGNDISDTDLVDFIVRDLRLLMVGETKIKNKTIIAEPHKRKPVDTKSANDFLIDLSHTIEHGLITYKGLPAPIVCDYLSRENSRKFYEEGTEFQIGKIEMVTNTGTYIDSPFHRFQNGKDLSDIGLESFTDLEATVIHVPHAQSLAVTKAQIGRASCRERVL